jgi:hypothetical protein
LRLPFSHDAFLDLFAAYNLALWPAAAVLWVATAWVFFTWVRSGHVGGRTLFTLLAVHWAWSGIAYHWFFFRRINPAAVMFAAMFLIQAGVFARLALTSRGRAVAAGGPRGVIGIGLVAYGLIYPLVGLGLGLEYPRMPVFAVPCPTLLVTAGWLVTSAGVPRASRIIPVIWAIVGSSAAFTLGIRGDLALVVAGGVLALDMLSPTAFGERPVPS